MTEQWNRRMILKQSLILGTISLTGKSLGAASMVGAIEDTHRRAIDHLVGLARRELKQGGMPFASLIVSPEGQWLADGVNSVAQSLDPSDHAEMQSIRKACQKVQKPSLQGSSCYVLCHPCPMCLSALMLAQVSHLYFVVDMSEKNAVMTHLNAGTDYYAELHKPFEHRLTRGRHMREERERVIQILQEWNDTFKK